MNIEIFKIAQTNINHSEVERWLFHLGAHEFVMPEEDVVSDPALVIALAAKRCYMSFEPGLNPNVTRVRKDYVDYFDNILASGHGSVLEHACFTFAIEGVSRVFTAEMNRHRAGWAISEGSLRFIRFDKEIPYWVPTSIEGPTTNMGTGLRRGDYDEDALADIKQCISDHGLDARKQITRELFADVFEYVKKRYGRLLAVWDMDATDKNFHYKKVVTSCLRRIVPLGVATGGVWTGNVRALRHVLAMRCSPAAEEEIAHVFTRIAEEMKETQPLLFGDFENGSGYYKPKYPKV